MNEAPSGRRERKRQQTADAIVQAARELFTGQGYAATTMEQIAARADVAKGTLYAHFPVKEAILGDYMRAELRAGEAQLAPRLAAAADTRARLDTLFACAATWLEPHRELLGPHIAYRLGHLRIDAPDPAQRSGLDAIIGRILGAGQAAGEVRGDIAVPVLAAQLEFAYLSVLLRWLAAPPGFDLPAALAEMLSLFLDGAGVRDAR